MGGGGGGRRDGRRISTLYLRIDMFLIIHGLYLRSEPLLRFFTQICHGTADIARDRDVLQHLSSNGTRFKLRREEEKMVRGRYETDDNPSY